MGFTFADPARVAEEKGERRKMSRELIDKILERLHRVFGVIETEDNVVISPMIRLFIRDLVFESLYLRLGEWQQHIGGNPADSANWDATANRVESSIRLILKGADSYPLPGGQKHVMLIGTLSLIHSQWCKIFPICR